MNNYLKIGAIFSQEFVDLVENNNSSGGNIVDEVYGSIVLHDRYTARPAFRLPDISIQELREYVKKLSSIGVKLNYTLNASYIRGRDYLYEEKKKIFDIVEILRSIGVEDFTVTLPFMAEIIRDKHKDVRLHISTIAHIDTVTQIKLWNKKYNISRVCMNLLKNRDIGFLRSAAAYCKKECIDIELIVNEFCGNVCYQGKETSATHCIYRDHCYQLHSIGYKKNDKGVLPYPMKQCTEGRNSNLAWLKQHFIRPEDLCRYNQLGINHFKVTGRTSNIEFMRKLLLAYSTESYEGNLIELWHHLENIEGKGRNNVLYIENKNLDGFLDHWFKNEFRCDNILCGEECTYCDDFMKKIEIDK